MTDKALHKLSFLKLGGKIYGDEKNIGKTFLTHLSEGPVM